MQYDASFRGHCIAGGGTAQKICVEDAHSTPIPPLGVVEGTKLTEKCGGGSVRDRFLAFPQRLPSPRGARRADSAKRARCAPDMAFESPKVGF